MCQEVKIALGAVAPTVIRATAAEALLRGQSVDAERLQQVAHAAAQAANPIDDIRGTAAHRRAVVAPLVQRTLHYAVQMAQGAVCHSRCSVVSRSRPFSSRAHYDTSTEPDY